MSDTIKHECGIAFVRLLKPLDFYLKKYGTPFYGLNKMQILMEKQHNRGQDGAGLANIKLFPKPGHVYINRIRSNDDTPIKEIFQRIYDRIEHAVTTDPSRLNNPAWLKEHVEFTGEVFLGHLRYGTFGKNDIENVHPVSRENNWMTRSLVLAGNFNLTNIDELYERLIDLGQYPPAKTDTVTILERIGHFLDRENEDKYRYFKDKGYSKREITDQLARHIDLKEILSLAARRWDGGYVMAGMIGHGDAFVMRDPCGIRPAYYYRDDEVVVAASERAVIQTTFNVPYENVQELAPGHALLVRRDGDVSDERFIAPQEVRPCSFERIYFSRGSDQDIYRERKRLGRLLVPQILKSIDGDIENTVFSYIPNTAESAFFGLVEGLDAHCAATRVQKIMAGRDTLTEERLHEILHYKPRIEKIAIKDVKMRTFITQDDERDDLVAHVYDVTYGTIRPDADNLVILDDSIVRGTTLRRSIIRILDRLRPKKIVVCSSAPQIRYPDCYGIDMSRLGDFVAFRAAIELLKEHGMHDVIDDVYRKAKIQMGLERSEAVNCVKKIYEPFTDEEISSKIAQIVTAPDIHAGIEVIYQSVENLHKAIPHHNGDWYFTGDYPTPGGNVVANKAFINFYENRNERAY
ncbi:amidophosphoribosyltransferase [Alistipes indistinctus]|uniref:amidophosphoribosyltransferase n=1 Tax=Alistipes indistinctus TaxID=626932 RepID=UPI003A84432B